MPSLRTFAAGASLLSAVAAQTSTSCNPTESEFFPLSFLTSLTHLECLLVANKTPSTETCGSDTGLDQSTYSVDFTQGASDDWNVTYGSVTYDETNGATYIISESGDAPTMQSNWYVFFGEVSVVMKAAPGTGIVSCAILESDDLDEVDWEWLGGSASQVETNYFGKGNTSTYDREQWIDVADSTQDDFHNYTIVWTESSLRWVIDGATVRTLAYADANGGASYPQSPMRVKLGTWAGGDASNSEGTIEWAGGATDYADGPFTAYVKSVSVTNYNPAAEYTYSDTSGSYESITMSGSSSSSSDDDDDGTQTTSSTKTQGASSPTASATMSSGAGSAGPGAIVSTNNSTANAGASNSTSSSSGTSSNSTSGSSSSSSSSPSGFSSTSAVATAGAPMWGPSLTVILGMLGFAAMMV